MPLFESYDRRINQINKVLNSYGISSVEEAKEICDAKGVDVYKIVKDIQPIAFENAMWSYIVGAAIAIKKGQTNAADIAATLGEGLQAFCIPGSVADDRKVGIGHGNLAAMLLREETKCFAFLDQLDCCLIHLVKIIGCKEYSVSEIGTQPSYII